METGIQIEFRGDQLVIKGWTPYEDTLRALPGELRNIGRRGRPENPYIHLPGAH
jgi:hypothetical protein